MEAAEAAVDAVSVEAAVAAVDAENKQPTLKSLMKIPANCRDFLCADLCENYLTEFSQ